MCPDSFLVVSSDSVPYHITEEERGKIPSRDMTIRLYMAFLLTLFLATT